MKPQTTLGTENSLGAGFDSGSGTAVFDAPKISRSRLPELEGIGVGRLGSRRLNVYQLESDVMEDLEWRMGL